METRLLKLEPREGDYKGYKVMSGAVSIGVITRIENAPEERWAWTIGAVAVHMDGRGPPQGAEASLSEAKAALAARWRHWLSAAGLKEVEPGDAV